MHKAIRYFARCYTVLIVKTCGRGVKHQSRSDTGARSPRGCAGARNSREHSPRHYIYEPTPDVSSDQATYVFIQIELGNGIFT